VRHAGGEPAERGELDLLQLALDVVVVGEIEQRVARGRAAGVARHHAAAQQVAGRAHAQQAPFVGDAGLEHGREGGVQVGEREPLHAVGRGVCHAEHAHRLRVGIHDAPARVDHDHAVGHVAQDVLADRLLLGEREPAFGRERGVGLRAQREQARHRGDGEEARAEDADLQKIDRLPAAGMAPGVFDEHREGGDGGRKQHHASFDDEPRPGEHDHHQRGHAAAVAAADPHDHRQREDVDHHLQRGSAAEAEAPQRIRKAEREHRHQVGEGGEHIDARALVTQAEFAPGNQEQPGQDQTEEVEVAQRSAARAFGARLRCAARISRRGGQHGGGHRSNRSRRRRARPRTRAR